jgi:hypothetical protein
MLTMRKYRHAQCKPSSSQAAMQFGISIPNALLIMLPYLLALLAAGGWSVARWRRRRWASHIVADPPLDHPRCDG